MTFIFFLFQPFTPQPFLPGIFFSIHFRDSVRLVLSCFWLFLNRKGVETETTSQTDFNFPYGKRGKNLNNKKKTKWTTTSRRHESGNQKQLVFQTVGIFIDAENIELSGLKNYEARTDYKKILDSVGDREIIRILYYKPEYKEISPDFQKFWQSLGGEIKRPQKNVDSFMVIDAVTMADKLDVVIILGGDRDFLPLVWYLKSRGCRVEIWAWPEATSQELKEAADFYYPLTADFMVN